MTQDDNNNTNNSNNNDDLYRISPEDKQTGLRAIEPLPGTLNLVIVRFDKAPIKVDLSLKEWAAKLKIEAKDCGVNDAALSVALKQLHLIESEKLLEVAHQNELQRNRDVADREAAKSTISSATTTDKISGPTLSPIKETDSEKLIHLIEQMGHEIFLDQYSHAFILAKDFAGNNGVQEPIELLDKDFVEYATGLFYDHFHQIIHTTDVANVGTILSHRAKRKNVDPETGEIIVRPLFVRVAWQDPDKRDTIYIDIADSKRHIIAIKAGQGFKVISQSDVPIMFRRQNRLPLPLPAEKYDSDIAEQFLNLYQIPEDAYYKRLMAKCMMGIRMIPGIPHPIELPHGGKGSLKSSWCEGQKDMIDPSTNKTLTIPNNEDDFALQGYHNYVLVYDNIKRKNVPKWFPDALCRYVYQEDVEKRQHYSNMKTVTFGSSGCALVNGINKMFEEEDVLDRCVWSEWRRLKKGQFKTKAWVKKEYERIRPQMLACLCDKVSQALAMYDQVEKQVQSQLTRMADFMVWGESIARAFGYEKGEFIQAYNSNLELQNVEIITNSTLGKVVVNLVHREYQLIIEDHRAVGKAAPITYNKAVGPKAVVVFRGTIDALHKKLQEVAQADPFNLDLQKAKDFPKVTNKLSQSLRLIMSNLSDAFGIEIEMTADGTGKLTGHKNRIWVEITKNPDVAPAELFGNEDKDGKDDKNNNDGRMRMRGKGKGDLPSPLGGRSAGDSRSKKLLSNQSFQSLLSLTWDSSEKSPSKDSKDSKDTFTKNSYTLQEVLSLATFDNKQKLHQVCRSLVNVDWEYTNDSADSADVYLFAYIDTNGKQGVLHVDDFATSKDFAIEVNRIIESYDYSVAYWSRGKDSDRITDLMEWHKYCIKMGAPSIVVPVSDYDPYPTIRSRNNPKHRHIDAYLIHNQTFIKSGVYKGAIGPMHLDDVHLAAFPNREIGKLPGVTGENVNDQPIEVQKAYCLRDAQLVYELMTKNNGQLLGVMQVIADYINRDIEYVCHARDMGYLVEPVLTQMGYPPQRDPETGKAIHWWDGTYTGGLVQPPIRGRHRHAIGIDCVGMYPEIVINYNISSETICCKCCEYDPKARERALTGDPELDAKGYWICVKREGLFPQFMKGLKEKRKEFKRLRDEAEERGDMEGYQQYDIAQLAIKLYMNASYGCFGFVGFKYVDKRSAEMITGVGRKFAIGAKEMAESEKHNFRCVYGDTDGLILIDKDPDVVFFSDETFTADNIKLHIKPLIDDCFQRFNLPIDNDRNFIEVTPVEKKQYFGIDLDTKKTLVRGLEGKKRDACKFNREQFKLLMSNYENGIDPIPDVKAGLEQLQRGEVTAEDLVFKTPLKRDADEYPLTSALGKVARACNGKKNDVVQYYLTGVKGNAWSLNIEDCNIREYLDEHLTDIGKVLYAMGYDVDELYGSEMRASKKLLKRREKNDNKKRKKKKQRSTSSQQEQQEVLEDFDN